MKKIKKQKKKRLPAGSRITDRMCGLCGTNIPLDKGLHRHHLQYEPTEIVKSLHAYTCHNIVHRRVKYHCPYDKKYNVDFSPVFVAIDILKMYKEVLPTIRKRFPELELGECPHCGEHDEYNVKL